MSDEIKIEELPAAGESEWTNLPHSVPNSVVANNLQQKAAPATSITRNPVARNPVARNLVQWPAGAATYSLRSMRAQAEIFAITRALEEAGWNRKRAAQLLRISYRGLLYKISSHKITRSTKADILGAEGAISFATEQIK